MTSAIRSDDKVAPRARALAELEPFLASGMLAVEWHHGVPAHARFSATRRDAIAEADRVGWIPAERVIAELA